MASAPALTDPTLAPGIAPTIAPTIAPIAPPPPVAHHPSFLKQLGHLGLVCVTKVLPVLTHGAQQAEPIIDLLFPLQGGIFTAVVNAVCLAEVAGAQTKASDSGAVKLQAVWTSVGPQLLDLAEKQGLIKADAEANAKQYIQAIFQLLNGPVKAPAAPTPAATA